MYQICMHKSRCEGGILSDEGVLRCLEVGMKNRLSMTNMEDTVLYVNLYRFDDC